MSLPCPLEKYVYPVPSPDGVDFVFQAFFVHGGDRWQRLVNVLRHCFWAFGFRMAVGSAFGYGSIAYTCVGEKGTRDFRNVGTTRVALTTRD